MRPLASGYSLVVRKPTIAEYVAIACSVGRKAAINHSTIKTALANSAYCIVAEQHQQAVGMGRIVSDGAMFFYIQDIAVCVNHQGNGIGTTIVKQLLTHIHTTAPSNAFVGLFAANKAKRFYEQFGFIANLGLNGMYQVQNSVANC
ncbi:MAG: GNAT family N-acetyltransferase [Candidatus Promineifilaceae bacterium]